MLQELLNTVVTTKQQVVARLKERLSPEERKQLKETLAELKAQEKELRANLR